ncbi:AAA family ATPase [Rhodoferax sp. BAB1]|uniref:AAA family ATPase n=1 Tax=Rhodoferax sp. BAB1 TaxID=2741720 RepID=UPI00157696AD|nr:AAA family ATPase [Rhodoferax sp. BAB1]QKO20546.1 AAA family ATPase [Rhodoferax sp. BAB1]
MRQNTKKDDTALPGYGDYAFKEDDTYSCVTLVLPNRLLQALTEERLAAEALKAQEEQDLRQSKAADESSPSAFFKPRSALGTNELDPERESKDLEEAAANSARVAETGEFIAVHEVLEPLKLIKDLKSRTPDRDIHKRNELLYKQIKARGHLRALAQPVVDLQGFEHLRKAFPHFSPVLDLVRDQYAFAELTGKPFLIPPILLGGDPGIGKTRFSQELAKALGTVMRRLPFDNGQSGVSLLGSDKNWANTTYGSVFELVVLGEYANPVILLDEVDKASKRPEGDPLASLHSLLEPVTSHRVRDISVDFEFNASRVVWIATANELDRIPASLRSRFHVFWIEQPSGAQALQMAEVLAQEVHQEMNLPGFQPPAQPLVRYIAHLSAREQIQALKRAYAAARVDGRHQVALADLPEQVRRDASEFAGEDVPPAGLLH